MRPFTPDERAAWFESRVMDVPQPPPSPRATAYRATSRPTSLPNNLVPPRSARGFSFYALPPQQAGYGRPEPIFEEHRVLATSNVLRYLSIEQRRPGPLPLPMVQHFNASRRPVTPFQPRPFGRLDGKGFGGRVGRSRGLGGNPIAWRHEGPIEVPYSEYGRAFSPIANRRGAGHQVLGVGMRTEVFAGTESAIHTTGMTPRK